MPQKLDKQSKLARLKSILTGSLSFEILKPPKYFFAFFNGTFYQIENLKLNEDEFCKWKEENVRPTDSLQIFEEKLSHLSPEDYKCIGSDKGTILIPKHKEPEIIVRPTDPNFFFDILKDTSKDIVLKIPTTHEVKQPETSQDEIIKETLAPKLERQVKRQFQIPDEVKIVAKEIKEKVKEEITAKPTRKTSGLMSEYGITWGVLEPELYRNSKYSPLN